MGMTKNKFLKMGGTKRKLNKYLLGETKNVIA